MALENGQTMPVQRAEVIAYRHEAPLFWISTYFAVMMWIVMIAFTLGLAIPIIFVIGLLGLFAHSLLISWIKGNAVKIDESQFPDLWAHYQHCCARLGVEKIPELYLAQADGMLNAMATRFMRRDYVVLLSSVVDALDDRPEAIRFYMGHELGHIRRKHLSRHWWLWPGMIYPLLSPAYSRACEYTCDRHGLACCNNLDDAKRALAILAVGQTRWKTMNTAAFQNQAQASGGFWMAVNELTSDYPWLCKRMCVLEKRDARFPRRSFFAWMIAAVSPRMGYGGAVIGFLYWLILGGVILALVGSLAFGMSFSGIKDKLEQKKTSLSSIAAPAVLVEEDDETEEDTHEAAEVNAPTEVDDDLIAPAYLRLVHVAHAVNVHIAAHGKMPPAELTDLGLALSETTEIDYEVETDATEDGKPGATEISLSTAVPCEGCSSGNSRYLLLTKSTEKPWECLAINVPNATLKSKRIDCVEFSLE